MAPPKEDKMSNLSIENLSKVVQAGDVNGLMGAGGLSGAGQVSEANVLKEMQAQGMQAPSAAGDGAHSFSSMLRNSVDQVNTYQHEADTAVKEMVAGRSKNIHETMLTIERADTSLKLMTQVRNKILDAYKEIMRMQV
jgi:flagellar hook-basal body complex protein FliE